MTKKKTQKKSSLKKIFSIFIVLLILAAAGLGIFYYYVFGPNTTSPTEGFYLYIPTGAPFSQVMDSLEKNHILKNAASFSRLAERKGYTMKVKSGRYLITNNMSNNSLVNMLRAGKQSPVNLTFNSIRTITQLAGRLSTTIETDSLSLLKYLKDPENSRKYGFTPQTVLLMFIPNTYEVYWNTAPSKLFERMNQEYRRFWNSERRKLSENIGLTAIQVGVLASIVEMETNKADEKPVVAGVYMNRIQRGIALQADPTVIFALGDFSIKRVLQKDLEFNSPYNTYKHQGLPPGPIAMPSVSSLESVLNYKRHNYLFFCAKPDLSGYHSFAPTLAKHMANARAYQNALDKMNIKH